MKQAAKEEADMTVRTAKEQLAQCLWFLHLEEGEFEIKRGRLVSKDGGMNIPVRRLVAIVPAHGTVMGVWPWK